MKKGLTIVMIISILIMWALIIYGCFKLNSDKLNTKSEYSENTLVDVETSISEKSTEEVDYKTDLATINKDVGVYNGTVIKSNGNPYCIKVNRLKNVVTVYEKDEEDNYTIPVKVMVCSVGLNNETPIGIFTTSQKKKWALLFGDVWGQYATRIEGTIMFHSVPYFTKDKGDLESEEYNKLGEAASQGCVRMAVIDVKWIYENCPRGTIVEIFDSEYEGPMGKPKAEKVDVTDKTTSGWDPTDMDIQNPWLKTLPIIYGVKDIIVERTKEPVYMAGIRGIDLNYTEVTDKILVDYSQVNTSNVGTYGITYNLTSINGSTINKTANVTVIDTIPPEILSVPEEIILNSEDLKQENLRDVLLTEVVGIDSGETLIKDSIHINLEAIIEKPAGNYQLLVYAQDVAGNTSEIKTMLVRVVN